MGGKGREGEGEDATFTLPFLLLPPLRVELGLGTSQKGNKRKKGGKEGNGEGEGGERREGGRLRHGFVWGMDAPDWTDAGRILPFPTS